MAAWRRGSRVAITFAVLSAALWTHPVPAPAATEPCPSGLVALTFDDGPSAVYTPRVLDVLAAHGAHATFFVNGPPAEQHPEIIERMHRDGHVIANHTWGHELLTSLSNANILATVRRLEATMARLGVPILTLVRPPFMGTSARVRRVLAEAGYTHILWDVDPWDWKGFSSRTISSHVLRWTHRGAVVLLHDGSGNAANMVRALPTILSGMAERGYCMGVLDAAGRVVPPADPEETRFEEEIAHLRDAGIAYGCGEDRFCPHDWVTRAQAASFLVRALRHRGDLPDGIGGTDRFSDDDGSAHEVNINRLAELGIIRGYPDGRFGPHDPVTRAQAASLLVRAFGLPRSDRDRFADDDESIHEAAINALAAARITYGCGSGDYCPARPLEREELAAMLVRLLGLSHPDAGPSHLPIVNVALVGPPE